MRLFEPEDYQFLSQWFLKREMHVPYVYLPSVGFIEDHFAAGFLIQTDTPVACIDFLVSNPDSDMKKRGEAIVHVVQALIDEARRRKFKALKVNSHIRSVERLSAAFGFNDLGDFRTFYKEI